MQRGEMEIRGELIKENGKSFGQNHFFSSSLMFILVDNIN
jgi:hypothetical protein